MIQGIEGAEPPRPAIPDDATRSAASVDTRPPVIAIGGPTASGKSALALALAERLGGVVINADSMQLYEALSILTARPGADALARAPHRLFGIARADDPWSAGRWRRCAAAEIEAARDAGLRPIVVGGTGLYLHALVDGLAAVPPPDPAIRARLRGLLEERGSAAMHDLLARRDPDGARAVRASDPQRILRALEVIEATGEPLHVWQARQAAPPAEGWSVLQILLMPGRDAVYAACEARFDRMIAEGAVEEARAVRAMKLDPALPAMKAVGLAPLLAHCAGALALEDAVAAAKRDTRRYARRQMTWFRNRSRPDRVVAEQYSESLVPEIFSFISDFRLTPNR
ncbi:MAG: tRNA (adenosine(37)-N6)-dimethylallyltransferase MiaA [Defluviicoccus sp.]|nr:tRNA (adenosine(37)-N6)-dimethylallyltransferase MiaA [Defluviicoccus sp.]